MKPMYPHKTVPTLLHLVESHLGLRYQHMLFDVVVTLRRARFENQLLSTLRPDDRCKNALLTYSFSFSY